MTGVLILWVIWLERWRLDDDFNFNLWKDVVGYGVLEVDLRFKLVIIVSYSYRHTWPDVYSYSNFALNFCI